MRGHKRDFQPARDFLKRLLPALHGVVQHGCLWVSAQTAARVPELPWEDADKVAEALLTDRTPSRWDGEPPHGIGYLGEHWQKTCAWLDLPDRVQGILADLLPRGQDVLEDLTRQLGCDPALSMLPEDRAGAADAVVHWIQGLTWLHNRDVRHKAPKAARGKRKSPAIVKHLTARQSEVVHVVGECDGDIAKAARRLGRDRKTIAESYKAAMKKLGKAVMPKAKTVRLPQDKRGQAAVAKDRRL